MPRRGKLQKPSPYCPEERKERDRQGFAKLFGQSQQGKRARPPRQTSGSRSRLALPRPRPAPGDNSGGNSDGGGGGGGSTSIHGRVPSASAAPASGGLDSGSASSVPSPDTHGEEEEEEEDIYTYDDDDPATGPIRSGGEPQAPGYDEEGALRKAMDESRREDEQREASKKEVGSLSSHGSGHTATPRGLSNPGRLCYVNALVQAVSSPSSTLGCTLLELAKLPAERRNALPATFKMADIARKVNSPSPAPTTPLSIEDAVRELLGQEFDSARQHCVYDAFGALAKRIDEESTRAGLQPSPLLASIAVECQTTARCMNGFCSTNGLERDVGQPATDFSLDVSFDDGCNTPTTLKALLHKLTKSCTVENNSCPGCDAVITDQRVVYTQLPPTLVIAVKRAMKDGSKNTRRLDFALTGTQFGGSNYDVRGIIVHEGERATSGHYKALVKAGGGAGGWFCADDRTVTEVPESDVLAQEASMFVLQREGTNAERASSAAVGAFLLGMAPSGAAMQGVDAGGVAAGDARASGSAGVNANGDGGGDSSSSGGGSSSGSVYKTVSDSDRSDGGGVVNDGNGSIGGGSVDSSGGGGDNTDGDSDGMDGDSSGKRRKSCDGGRKKEHGGGCREDSSGNSSTGGATSKATSGGSSSSSNGAEKCGTAAAAALPKRRRVDGGSAGGAAKRKKSGGGSGNTTGEEPTSGDDDDDSSGSGSKSRSMSRSRGRSRSSSSSGGGSSSDEADDLRRRKGKIPDNVGGGLGHSGQSAESAQPRKKQRRADKPIDGALQKLAGTPEEVQKFLRLSTEASPQQLALCRALLKDGGAGLLSAKHASNDRRIYRGGATSGSDLGPAPIRNILAAASQTRGPVGDMAAVLDGPESTERRRAEEGLRRLRVAAEAGDVDAFLGVCGEIDVSIHIDTTHPAFANNAGRTEPLLVGWGACPKYAESPFYDPDCPLLTGKLWRAAVKASPFGGDAGGAIAALNKNNSCSRSVHDRGGNCFDSTTMPARVRELSRTFRDLTCMLLLNRFPNVHALMVLGFGEVCDQGAARHGVEWSGRDGKVGTFASHHICTIPGGLPAATSNFAGLCLLHRAARDRKGCRTLEDLGGERRRSAVADAVDALVGAADFVQPKKSAAAFHGEKKALRAGVEENDEVFEEAFNAIRTRLGPALFTKQQCSDGGAAKYTPEERGAEKSTVELKAEGGKADYAEGAALPGGGTSKGTRKGKGAGGAASAGVDPEGRGPRGDNDWKRDEDLMEPYRFLAGASVTVGDRNVTLPSMTLRCESQVAGDARPVAFLVETTGVIAAEERQCSRCRKYLRVVEADKKTLQTLGIQVHSASTSGRRRRASKLRTP